MPIKFDRSNKWPGGALHAIEEKINELQKTLEDIKSGHFIRFDGAGENSIKVSYAGPDGASRWTGKVWLFGESSPLVDLDVTKEKYEDPENPPELIYTIRGKYICIEQATRSWEWADAPKEETGWHSYKVADTYATTPAAPSNGAGQFGTYRLTKETCGDIVVGGGSGGSWSGIVRDFYGNIISTTSVSSIHGTHVWYFTGLIANVYTPTDGTALTDSAGGRLFWRDGEHYSGSVPSFMVWKVANELLDENSESYSPKQYVLDSSVGGDIRIAFPIPTAAYKVVRQGGGAGGDNGVGPNYVQAH